VEDLAAVELGLATLRLIHIVFAPFNLLQLKPAQVVVEVALGDSVQQTSSV
jgi:hypothetical protein